MAEQAGQSASLLTGESQTQTVPGSVEAETPDITNYIGPDGKFLEGWRDGLLPEELRKEKFFDIFSDIRGVLKTAGHQAKRMSEKGVFPPDDKSTPEEINAFYKAAGRPDKPEDYKMEVPKGQEKDFSPELITEGKNILHNIGISRKQADALWEFEKKRVALGEKALNDFEEKQEAEAERIINEKYGTDKEVMIHRASLAIDNITKNWGKEEKDFLFAPGAGINDTVFAELRPLFLKFLSGIGEMFEEGKMSDVEGETRTLQSAIDKLESSPAYMDKNHKEHEMVMKERDELYKKLYSGK